MTNQKVVLASLASMKRSLAVLIMMTTLSSGFQSLARFARPTTSSGTIILAMKSKSTTTREGDFWKARMDGWRPTVNDVERISWGKSAKKKGTGSRGVPHRLNEEERILFDQARRKGFLEVAGSGWRSQRREAPLLNSYRSLCDARGQASVILLKGHTGLDELIVDLSPLRNPETFEEIANVCLEQKEGGELVFQSSVVEESEEDVEEFSKSSFNDEISPWESRPIYQLPPYCVTWELPRSEAKALGKQMAAMFDTVEGKMAPSKKPVGVKAGKSRRHGGYGIG
jgi:hypothetical protein